MLHRTVRTILAVSTTALLAFSTQASAQTPVAAGFQDAAFPSTVTAAPTGEKPESKVWFNDGEWWAAMYNAAASYNIFRLDQNTEGWVDTGTVIDARTTSKADVLWDSTTSKLYITVNSYTSLGKAATSEGQRGKLYRYSYNSGTKTYTLDSGFTNVKINNGRAEALTIAKDSVGRLWITWVEDSSVMVNNSISPADDKIWATPSVLPASPSAVAVAEDDISAIIAFGGNKTGVAWSNHATNITYFSYRNDIDPTTTWQAAEMILPGPGCSGICTDDHLNLKADSLGRVFLATKTGLSSGADPLDLLAVRSTGGTWSTTVFSTETYHHTRPIVLLDEPHNRLYMFATSPESGGSIYYKTAPLDSIAFTDGLGQLFIASAADTKINNATSTKQNLNSSTGLLVLASDSTSRRYLHNRLFLSSATITSFTPTNGPAGTVVTINGTDLSGATAVTFNGVTATFSPVSSTELQATVPSGATTGRIIVATPGGDATSATDFTVPPVQQAPQITSFTPTTGVIGTAVTVNGANFTNVTQVTFNGVALATYGLVGSTQITFNVPAGATSGPIGVYTTVGSVITPTSFTVTTGGGSNPVGSLRNVTFESGALVNLANGVDAISGTVALESASPVKGSYSARVAAKNGYLRVNFGATANLFTSMYLRITAYPASDMRLVQVMNGSSTVGNLYLTKTGQLKLRNNSTNIGVASGTLALNQSYRIGIHQKVGTGANAVLEAFLASGDSAFSAPFAAIANGKWKTNADQLRVGSTNGVLLNVTFDDIRIDNATMPGPSVP